MVMILYFVVAKQPGTYDLTSFYHCFIISSMFLICFSSSLSSFPMKTITRMINRMILDDNSMINMSQKGKHADDLGIFVFCHHAVLRGPWLIKSKFNLLLLPTTPSKLSVCLLSLSILILFYLCLGIRSKFGREIKRTRPRSVLTIS